MIIKVILVLVSVSSFFGCYVQSPMQSARMLDTGNLRVAASQSFATYTHVEKDKSSGDWEFSNDVTEYVTSAFFDYGITKSVNVISTLNYVNCRENYPSMLYTSAGVKYAIINDKLASTVKLFNYFFDESKGFKTYGFDLMAVYSFDTFKYAQISTMLGFTYFAEDVNSSFYTVLSTDIGPNINKWALKPEITISTLNPTTGVHVSWDIGFSYLFRLF